MAVFPLAASRNIGKRPSRGETDDAYACRSNEIRSFNRPRDDRNVWSSGTQPTNPIRAKVSGSRGAHSIQTIRTPQSVSPRGGLADASQEHEWRSLGRGNQGAHCPRWEHLDGTFARATTTSEFQVGHRGVAPDRAPDAHDPGGLRPRASCRQAGWHRGPGHPG